MYDFEFSQYQFPIIPELRKLLLSFFFDFFSVLSIICFESSLRLLGL